MSDDVCGSDGPFDLTCVLESSHSGLCRSQTGRTIIHWDRVAGSTNMSDRLSNEAVTVAANGHNNTWTLVEVVRSLAREVQASRKLVADLRATIQCGCCVSTRQAIRMIDEAGL